MKKQCLAIVALVLSTTLAHARTITLTGEDCEEMACITTEAPRLSWFGASGGPGVFDNNAQLQLRGGMAMLMKFPLTPIPKDQRILKAELSFVSTYVAGKARIQTRRLLADWGTGVSHLYRRTFPKKEEWSQAGGRGAGTDRANKDSGVFVVDAVGEHTIDVTEDIELWYTGAALNRGWIMNLENDGTAVYLNAPYSPHGGAAKLWKLKITFEPK